MSIINTVNLQYNYLNDAGYDLILDLDKVSVNTSRFLDYLVTDYTSNLNWYKNYGVYLPKLYLNGSLIGSYENKKELDLYVKDIKANKSSYVALPPSRIACEKLAYSFANFSNTELLKTGFNFQKPVLEPELAEQLSIAGFVYPRSGLGAKHQISIANNVGVVDLEYTNNVMVAIENRGRDIHTFTNGCRIAQLVIGVILNNPYKLEPLKDKLREHLGFGSTGQ